MLAVDLALLHGHTKVHDLIQACETHHNKYCTVQFANCFKGDVSKKMTFVRNVTLKTG